MKVGEYVRTTYGIRKIVEIEKDECYKPRVKVLVFDRYIEEVRHFGYKFYTDEKIIKEAKHSPNIIDLIEKNDLVVDNYGNVYVVDNVFDNYIYTTTKQGNIIKTLCDYQIKSIVTREQFSQMEYKVKE